MQASADSLAFAPPPEPAAFRGFALAVIAHLLLLIALTWGINWQRDDQASAVEAELWSSIPQEAAPPPAPPQPEVKQPPVVQPAPPPPVAKQPDIAVEREKQRREEEARKRQEEEQRKQLEAQKRKLEEQQKLAEEKKQKEELAKQDKQKKELEAKKLDQLRKEQLARMQALAAGTGSPTSQGTAATSKGPSASYAAKIAARIKPNIVFTDVVSGNPTAEAVVRVAPDGTIVNVKLTKSSGVKAWDDAVVRAIEKTERIPRDVDGTVVSQFPISFRPNDR
jgi:colicin import membrane protein